MRERAAQVADRYAAMDQAHGFDGEGYGMIAAEIRALPLTTPGADEGRPQFIIDEREDDMLICRRHWQFGYECIARRPKLLRNDEWRSIAEMIVAALNAARLTAQDAGVREADDATVLAVANAERSYLRPDLPPLTRLAMTSVEADRYRAIATAALATPAPVQDGGAEAQS